MVTENPSKNYSANAGATTAVRLAVPAACSGLRLDQALARMLPEQSRNRLAQWARSGRISLNGAAALPKRKVWEGDAITILPGPDPEVVAFRAEALPLSIVYEDDALLVIDKPAGLVVHPGSGNWQGTLLNALLAHAPSLSTLPRAGIVHRLDKDTSGLLVVAKTPVAQTDLVRQLQSRSVRREYLALVHGRVARAGRVEAAIGRHPVKRTRMAVTPGGRYAVTHYEVIERYDGTTLLRCRLETGRTHQIRVHMSAAGHPLVGDPVYGKRRSPIAFPRQALHAERLDVIHPVTRKPMSWRAELPADMQRLIRTLRSEASAGNRSPVTGHRSRVR